MPTRKTWRMTARTCITGLLVAALLTAGGCRRRAPEARPALRILCSTLPMYLFTANVAASRKDASVELMLSPSTGCPHDYVLTPQNLARMADSDVVVVNGLGLDAFVFPAVARAGAKLKILDASAGLADIVQIKPGPTDSHSTEKQHEHAGANPHMFASPRMAAKIVRNIASQLSAIDPDGAALYSRNASAYAAKLDALADEFASAGKTLRSRKIVTEHAVFDYLARDTGLEIVAVIEESPGQEPSAAEMLDLVKLVKTSGAGAVFTEPQYPAGVGKTIAKEAGVPVAVLDPVASGPENPPLDYYQKTMAANLETLQKTLGVK